MTSAALTAEIQALRAELDAGKHALVLARALELGATADPHSRAILQLLVSNAYGILGEPVKALAAALDAMAVAQTLARKTNGSAWFVLNSLPNKSTCRIFH